MIQITPIIRYRLYLGIVVFFFVGLFLLPGLSYFSVQKQIFNQIKNDLKNDPHLSEEDILKKIFLFLREQKFKRWSFQKKFRIVHQLQTTLTTPKASVNSVFITLVIYIIVIVAPIVYFFQHYYPIISFPHLPF